MGSELRPWTERDWLETTWGELVELKYGKSLKNYKDRTSGFQVFGTNGPVGYHDTPLCKSPSVIIGRKGAYRGVHFSPEPFFVIDTAFYIEPIFNINIKWAYYQLLTADINGLDSGSAIPSTRREDFYSLRVKVPPLHVQDAICAHLDKMNEKITLNRQINQTLEQMAQALFKSWFVDFDPVIDNALAAGNPIPDELQPRAEQRKRLQLKANGEDGYKPLPDSVRALFPDAFEESELGWVPEGWVVSSVGAEFDVTMGQSPPGSSYNEEGIGQPFFQGKTDFGFRFPENRIFCTEPKRLAKKNDTLISVRAPVGTINLAASDCVIGRGLAAVRHHSGSVSFTYYSMNNLAKHFAVFEGEGTVFGSINQKAFKALSVLKLPSDLVCKFDELCTVWDQRIEISDCEAKHLTNLRDTLLPKLISGELQLDQLPDVAASVA